MIVKHDVGGNIDRLATCAATKPDVYQADVFAMVRASQDALLDLETFLCPRTMALRLQCGTSQRNRCTCRPAPTPILLQVRDDVAAGTHTGSSSVTKGLLWLKRCAWCGDPTRLRQHRMRLQPLRVLLFQS